MIRQFNFARDYDSVIRLWQSAAPGVALGPSDTPQEIQKKITRDPDLFLVAEEGGAIIGAVIGAFDGRRGAVYHLAVAASHRSRGLGAALMRELESRLKAKGCLKYYLQITPDNTGVIEFYRRLGWQTSPNIFMSKTIDG
ncbi:MAG: GNAT family acetyltransferase [Chloroflexi bacterium]|nr:GNAT family acetyltransferase [Chloroflexota bacterium]